MVILLLVTFWLLIWESVKVNAFIQSLPGLDEYYSLREWYYCAGVATYPISVEEAEAIREGLRRICLREGRTHHDGRLLADLSLFIGDRDPKVSRMPKKSTAGHCFRQGRPDWGVRVWVRGTASIRTLVHELMHSIQPEIVTGVDSQRTLGDSYHEDGLSASERERRYREHPLEREARWAEERAFEAMLDGDQAAAPLWALYRKYSEAQKAKEAAEDERHRALVAKIKSWRK